MMLYRNCANAVPTYIGRHGRDCPVKKAVRTIVLQLRRWRALWRPFRMLLSLKIPAQWRSGHLTMPPVLPRMMT